MVSGSILDSICKSISKDLTQFATPCSIHLQSRSFGTVAALRAQRIGSIYIYSFYIHLVSYLSVYRIYINIYKYTLYISNALRAQSRHRAKPAALKLDSTWVWVRAQCFQSVRERAQGTAHRKRRHAKTAAQLTSTADAD